MANNNVLWLFGFIFIIVIVGVGVYIYFKYKNQSSQPRYSHGFPMSFDADPHKYILWDPAASVAPIKQNSSGGYFIKS